MVNRELLRVADETQADHDLRVEVKLYSVAGRMFNVEMSTVECLHYF